MPYCRNRCTITEMRADCLYLAGKRCRSCCISFDASGQGGGVTSDHSSGCSATLLGGRTISQCPRCLTSDEHMCLLADRAATGRVREGSGECGQPGGLSAGPTAPPARRTAREECPAQHQVGHPRSPLKEGCHLFDTKRFSQEQPHLNAAP